MKFYMIEDLNSKLWYKRGPFGGGWVEQDQASVWTTPAGPGAAKGNITHYNKTHSGRILPREPEIRVLDLEKNPALEALRALYEVIDLEVLTPHVYGTHTRKAHWRMACADAVRLV